MNARPQVLRANFFHRIFFLALGSGETGRRLHVQSSVCYPLQSHVFVISITAKCRNLFSLFLVVQAVPAINYQCVKQVQKVA